MHLLSRLKHVLCCLAVAAGLAAPAHARQTVLTNTARLSYVGAAGPGAVTSNTTTLPVTARAAPRISLMRLAIGAAGETVQAAGSWCMVEGRGFTTPDMGESSPFDPTSVKLRPATSFHAGEPAFIEIIDATENRDAKAREVITLTLKTGLGDQETVKVEETGADTGRFVGYIPVTEELPGKPWDCRISTPRGGWLDVSVLDADGALLASASALIDPYGYIFDSRTGKAIDGARVTLIDQQTGLPAQVVGDDGVSAYPSTVISGRNVVDGGGAVYEYAPGQYRFPLVPAGRYALFVEPPTGYSAPSSATEKALAKLTAPDGNSFRILPASWGEAFDLIDADPLQIDIPLDSGVLPGVFRRFVSGLSLEKSASVEKASFGDQVRYALTIRAIGSARAVPEVVVRDVLPVGFRYVAGSSRRDDKPLADPVVSADGQTLTYALGDFAPNQASRVSYLVTVGPGTPVGAAINRATASGAWGASSGEAQARVRVTSPLMTDAGTIIGRVTEGACGPSRKQDRVGVAGVRVLLEDGTFVTTDRDGLFHIEGVRPGLHVAQLDVGALPPGLEMVRCGRDTRTGGRAFSQFVDLRGGDLKRVEFRLRRVTAKAPIAPAGVAIDEAAPGQIDWFAGQSRDEDFVFPAVGHNPPAPAIRVAVRHAPGRKVSLTLNGAPVDPLARDGVETSADASMAVSLWRGVPLVEGANVLVARITNASGDVVAELKREVAYANVPARATLVAEASRLSADGLSAPVIAVRFTDRFGHPVRPGAMGTFEVSAPYAAAPDAEALQARKLTAEGGRSASWRVIGSDGVALIPLVPTSQAGPATLRFKLPGLGEAAPPSEVRAWLRADRQDWVVVGFAAGTAGYQTLSRHADRLPRLARGKTLLDGQAAFYAKGRVRGSWLLTLAYDNKGLADPARGLTSAIDPDRYYTVYGDASAQGHDAASQGKLYVRLERGAFYALFGDFQTGFDATRLGRFERTLNGAKFERQGRVLTFAGFMAQTRQDHVRDELAGSGLAGLYQLSRRDIIPNTETVTLETRDRLRSERVLASRALTRNIDYDIDYLTGALTFRDPIASRDQDLNPNIIVAQYEIDAGGEKTTETGLRASAELLDGKLRAGVTYLHGRPGQARDEADMVAANLTLRPRADTEVRLEAAASQSVSTGRQDAFIAEVEHHSARLDLLGYVRQADAAFGLGQQGQAELGARKVGVDAKARLSDTLSLAATAYRQDDLATGEKREVVESRLDYARADTRLGAALKTARDGDDRSDLLTLTAGRDLMNRRLQLTASSDFALGDTHSRAFPIRRRLGAAFEVREGLRLLASRELIEGQGYTAAVTSAGVEAAPWKGARMTSALNAQDLSAFGPRTYARMGLSQSLRLTGGWTADVSVDASRTLAGQAPELEGADARDVGAALVTEDFTAVSLGAAYRADLWSANGRVEARRGDRSDSWALRGAVLRQLREGVDAAVTVRADETVTKAGAMSRGVEAAGSLAWRPLDSAWSVLEKLEVRREVAHGVVEGSNLAGHGPTARGDGVTAKVINNLAVNYDSDRGDHQRWAVQASVYHGAKLVRGDVDGGARTNLVQVLGAEARLDVSRRVDVGLNLSLRHARHGGTAYAFGPSIGVAPGSNAWISVGWNLTGYNDPDFDNASYSRQGFYVTARVKFDQTTFAGLRRSAAGGRS